MGMTSEQAKEVARKLREKFGDDYYSKISKGQKRNTVGFAHGKVDPRVAGAKGGKSKKK
jgi:hypothetical protein